MDKITFGARLAAVVMALIAVVVFIIDVVGDRNERYHNRVDTWRKAAIQKAFQRDDDNRLTIPELLTQIKGMAWDELDIKRDDLTEDEIRVLLLELISLEVIYQGRMDTYELRFNTVTTSSAEQAVINILTEPKKLNEAFEELMKNPYLYTRDSFYEKHARKIPVTRYKYDLIIDAMIKSQRIKLNESGQMRLTSPSGEAPPDAGK